MTGVFSGLSIPGGRGNRMQCPSCGQHTTDEWRKFLVRPSHPGSESFELAVSDEPLAGFVWLDWMACRNPQCKQLVIRLHEAHFELPPGGVSAGEAMAVTESHLVRPRFSRRPVDPLIPEEVARDYREASAVLDMSPRLSAVMSRSILADLLERHLGLDDFGLKARIDKFRSDEQHPQVLREHMHHFREIADFGAHTQRTNEDEIVPVDRASAEWLLDYLDAVFDYLIVTPARNRVMAQKWDKNIEDAGRQPIPPLSEES